MVRCVVEGGVGRVVLDRPGKKNALTVRMLEMTIEGVARLVGDPGCGAVVLSGEGSAFCAGFDLSICREDETALEQLLARLAGAVKVLRECDVPVVIAAHGAAIAGGCALLGAGDLVVTDAGAKIGYPVVRLGISPAVSAPTLRLAVGDGAARARMLDPGLIDGRAAVRIGLAHRCVEKPGEVLGAALEIAGSLACKPRRGVAATKRWLNELDGGATGPLLDAALGVSLSLVGSDEERERLAALWSAGEREETGGGVRETR